MGSANEPTLEESVAILLPGGTGASRTCLAESRTFLISIILYGRNDSYGYNLHKRAALSLNCMAAVLTAPGDEILFVDYNTPDDFPTFPEAIRDTLTPRAQRLLRILRVRLVKHARLKAGNTSQSARADLPKCGFASVQSRESMDSFDQHRYDLCATGRSFIKPNCERP